MTLRALLPPRREAMGVDPGPPPPGATSGSVQA